MLYQKAISSFQVCILQRDFISDLKSEAIVTELHDRFEFGRFPLCEAVIEFSNLNFIVLEKVCNSFHFIDIILSRVLKGLLVLLRVVLQTLILLSNW